MWSTERALRNRIRTTQILKVTPFEATKCPAARSGGQRLPIKWHRGHDRALDCKSGRSFGRQPVNSIVKPARHFDPGAQTRGNRLYTSDGPRALKANAAYPSLGADQALMVLKSNCHVEDLLVIGRVFAEHFLKMIYHWQTVLKSPIFVFLVRMTTDLIWRVARAKRKIKTLVDQMLRNRHYGCSSNDPRFASRLTRKRSLKRLINGVNSADFAATL